MEEQNSLSHLEEIINSRDAVMRPDIKDVLLEYEAKGGDVQQIISKMLNNFQGIPIFIDVAAQVLSILEMDPREEVERQIKKTVLGLFVNNPNSKQDISEIDKYFFQRETPPKLMEIIFKNRMWISAIVEITQNLKKEKKDIPLFFSYCINKICMKFPECVKVLPRCYIEYSAYAKVLQSILERMKTDKTLKHNLIDIFCTDDLTIGHAAVLCNSLNDPSIIFEIAEASKAIDMNLFNLFMLKMDNYDDNTISSLIRSKEYDLQMIKSLQENLKPSCYSKQLINNKIKTKLFGQNDKEYLDAAINLLISMSNDNVDENEKEFIINTINNFIKSNWDSQMLSNACYAIKKEFFADILLDKVLEQIDKKPKHIKYKNQQSNSSVFPFDQSELCVQTLILCEIAFNYPKKCTYIINNISNVFNKTSDDVIGNQCHIVLIYLIMIGFVVDVLNSLKSSEVSHIKYRRLILDFLFSTKPPYSDEFIEALANYLNDEKIIQTLLIPKNVLANNIPRMKQFLTFIESADIDIDKPYYDFYTDISERLQSHISKF